MIAVLWLSVPLSDTREEEGTLREGGGARPSLHLGQIEPTGDSEPSGEPLKATPDKRSGGQLTLADLTWKL